MEADAIRAAMTRLSEAGSFDATQFEKAVKLLNEALDRGGKIVVTGVGKSGKIAQKIAATLSSTGSQSTFLHPTEGLHGDLGFIQSKDVILALSHTGNTEELLRILPAFKAMKTPILALTGNRKSLLAESADAVIFSHVEQEACPHNLAPTSSTTLALALGDALAISLMELRKFDAAAFAKNHPGGSLGRRLNLSVADVMHKGDAVGTANLDTLMDQIAILATQKRLGGVLVVDGKKLLGIVTDGDIRKALSHREKFFQMKAREIMTPSPITATPDMPARDALTLMENRPSPISILPVVNSGGEWIGIIRLHDLIQSF